MTRKYLSLFLILLTACAAINAQTAATGVKTLTDERLSFDYPADWKLVDKSNDQLQQYSLFPAKGNVLIMIVGYRTGNREHQNLESLKKDLSQPRIDQIANTFTDLKKEEVCAGTPDRRIPGLKMTGRQGGEEAAGTSYSFLLDHKFFNLIFIRETKESAQADPAWEMVFNSLKVDHKIADTDSSLNLDDDLVLNGKAFKLPRPFPIDRVEHMVQVRVFIDETGKVTRADGYSGNPIYFPSTIAAAKKAKFTPTILCGEAVKVTGLINYNFVR